MYEFVLNITNDYDPVYYECDPDFEAWFEVTRYFIQLLYLIPGAILNVRIFYTIWFKHRENYLQSSYFIIFSVDCFVGFFAIQCDILTRFTMYFTPACPYLAPFFYDPLVFFKGVLITMNHCKISKFLIQSVLVFNRMTCVIYPNSYTGIWKRSLKYVIPLIILIPISTDWNLAISRVYMIPTFGGVFPEYIKKIKWASQSKFSLLFLSIALFFTVICTCITLYSLIMLPHRLVKFERLITIGSAYVSLCYVFFAMIQFMYAFFPSLVSGDLPFGFALLMLDILNVGSPIIMLCVSSGLRNHVLNLKPKPSERVFEAVNSAR